MPQLDTTPWFFILSTAWVIFMVLMPMKIMKLTNLNIPVPKPSEELNKSWSWPWP